MKFKRLKRWHRKILPPSLAPSLPPSLPPSPLSLYTISPYGVIRLKMRGNILTLSLPFSLPLLSNWPWYPSSKWKPHAAASVISCTLFFPLLLKMRGQITHTHRERDTSYTQCEIRPVQTDHAAVLSQICPLGRVRGVKYLV